MKRNKPIAKNRKPGTRRPYSWGDERGTSYWALAVPQAFAGVGQTVLDMSGAVAAGADAARPDDPRFFGSSFRWRLDRDGQTEFVHGLWIWDGRPSHMSPSAYGRQVAKRVRTSIPTSPDVYHVFTAERAGCTRGMRCPLAYHFYSDAHMDLSQHRPNRCAMSVLSDGPPWRLVGRTVPDGRLIC